MAPAVRVGRLAVRPAGPGRDLIARRHAESRVTSLDLAPPGFADHAVLVVRRVRWRADRRLAEAARADLDDLYRTAARPGSGHVPDPAAPAVVFADEAQLLACLTRDALAGQLNRWYWRHLAPKGAVRTGAVLTAAWTERVRWLPAALSALPIVESVRAVSTLAPTEALYVLRILLAEYAAPVAFAAPPPLADAARPEPGDVADGEDSPDPTAPGTHASPTRAMASTRVGPLTSLAARALAVPVAPIVPPWRPWLGDLGQSIPPEHEALLGVAVTLHAAPVLVRRPDFVGRIAAWLRTPTVARPSESAQPQATPYAGPPATNAIPVRLESVARTAAVDVAVAVQSDGPAAPGAAPVVLTDATTRDPAAEVAATASVVPWAGGVPSRFASALYLINVLVWLDLPGTWPADALPSGWATIELLARHLLADQAVPDSDPLWALLAELDGREPGTPADAGVTPEEPIRLPAAWLRRWASAPARWAWVEHSGRLAVTDDQRGFVVADVPLHGADAERAAYAELCRLQAAGVPGLMHAGTGRQRTSGRSRWGDVVGQFVAWLLANREVPAEALAQPGRVAVTRTHVDVVLDLECIDLAARACGLDRDPGWMPDLGRIVAFHFEAGVSAC